jgi:hypothetical protein
MYMAASQAGSLKVITGRDGEGRLGASAFIFTAPHPHYACICASLPLLYVDPAYRNGREGINLIKVVEYIAEQAGAQMLYTHGGIHNGVSKLFEFLKYDDFGRYFVKVLAKGDSLAPIFKEE